MDACSIILFGATGDLTHRKLVPALWKLFRAELLPERFCIVGVARRPKSNDEFRDGLEVALRKHATPKAADEDALSTFLGRIYYEQLSFNEAASYSALAERMNAIEAENNLPRNRLFYLSTAPEFFAPVVKLLGENGLVERRSGSGHSCPVHWSRVVVEKPFGHDLESARQLNRDLVDVLDESQIYRIDHYLGKETVQNILALRFSNGIFEPLWNQKYIDHVQITVSESLGVGTRGGYYDTSGALRDMVQNHMMQLLSLVAMEPPISLDADAIRNEKVKVLQALRPLSIEEVESSTTRAQYVDGETEGEKAIAYVDEDRVPADSKTPTYVALKLQVDNWRWAGTPFFLRHGKRLPHRVTEIAIQFRKPPMRLFEQTASCEAIPNTLVMEIQPNEGISLSFGSKIPGPAIRVGPVKMDFLYKEAFSAESSEAYERLLLDALAGDSTLFTRSDEVESSWKYMDTILQAWDKSPNSPDNYAAGTWGPKSADRLFDGTEGEWRDPSADSQGDC